LNHFPEEVIEDWIYRHNPQFLTDWASYNLEEWEFELVEFTSDKVLEISHLEGEIQEWESKGGRILERLDTPFELKLARVMVKCGTYPVPIIIAFEADQVSHPRGNEHECMATPYQLLEGHKRLGIFRAMSKNESYELLDKHKVWLVTEVK
jgi:hypothetical protein